VCCSVLQCVAVCCNVYKCVAMCAGVLQYAKCVVACTSPTFAAAPERWTREYVSMYVHT